MLSPFISGHLNQRVFWREVLTVKALLMGWVVLIFSIPLAGLAETADDLEEPSGPVILTVSGNVGLTNVGSEAQFDRAILEALPQHEFDTTTPWTEASNHYRGPLMRDLLARLNAESDTVHVVALNGYEAEIPVSDFEEYDVILALEKDEKAIPIREYGPLWVLYPFDQDEALLSEKIRFRAVWQVMHIDVR
ncbi:molybdopterin-dependent oxidoreductase [Vreelandella maris]|uniref:Molybdopterin-dependent oxidoreductase n=1 Tax=Vreelandella maris TaxID=2729617 RepID=A0A7Y6V7H3_9GAMM|nr:molybdopterin-dependent oxidoreductase [Halomonas maris]NVF13244.1 molybdopterin-dependent oxidoreductase [Halomonas maris]|tara:strand:- start:263 stop:838 length:576 start_codon:yes stop_codon:yes gene_type:complete